MSADAMATNGAPRPLVRLAADSLDRADEVGGKAASLAQLAAWGLAPPPWYVVTAAALELALAATEQATVAPTQELPAADEVGALALPPVLADAVAAAHAATIPPGLLVAVRSSAIGEDAAGESFAGVHESVLFVPPGAAVFDAIRQVWASAFAARALAYRAAHGLPERPSIAVVVQAMVEPRSSAVVFTAHPTTGDVHEVVVSALWGAGEALVGRGFDADSWTVDKSSGETAATIVAKQELLELDRERGSGLRTVAVPAARQQAPSLDDAEVTAIVELALRVERLAGRPQDLELAVDPEGTVWLLQARPITTVEELGPAAGNRLLWDNANIVESYSGVTTPLTFAFIRRAYAVVYERFCEVMGVAPAVVAAHRPVFENMLGLFRGEVYYNLRSWYRVVRLFPGYELNRAFMESMMGVRESVREDEPPVDGGGRGRLRDALGVARLAVATAWRFARIDRIVAEFDAHFRRHHDRWAALDLRALAPHELMALYREMETRLLWQWKAPIVNDFYVMVFYGTLRTLCARWCGAALAEAPALQNDLLCGEGGIESTAPTRRLLALANQARTDPPLRELLLGTEPAASPAALRADPRFTEFVAAIDDYLARWGLRCVDELKLESRSLRDDPGFLFQMLRNYLAADPAATDLAAMERREREVRARAEERAFAALGRGAAGVLRRFVFRRVLRNARRGVRHRENLRFARTRVYGLLRELVRAMGERLEHAGVLRQREDIFFLTLEEVWDFVKGTAVTTDLAGLAALRQAEFAGYRDSPQRRPADRFETFGMAYHRNLLRGRARRGDAATAAATGTLQGTPCCPGVVTAAVQVVASPAAATLRGEILVAERTDPGWVPLFPSASGLLVERGSILSHSAIVAREMGLPTIVGIPGLVATLRSGETVRMDGGSGTVERLES